MPKRGQPCQPVIAVPLLAVVTVLTTHAGNRSPETDLAAPGSALYEYAVTESVKSLMSKQEQAELGVAGRPPSPGPDYYWCENHKTYHQNENAASAGQPGVVPATPQQVGGGAAAKPASPGADYYWCDECRSYHQRQSLTNHVGAAVQGSAGTQPRQGTAAGTAGDARPPSPGEGFYWCENCKTYHLRQTSAQQPGASSTNAHVHSAAAVGGAGASGDYYYCENCKTYHRRQPAIPPPLGGLNSILGGGSNSPLWNPLVVPGEAER